MKVGLMSDSHDNIVKIKDAVDIFNARQVDFVLHAGDFVAPFSIMAFKKLKCNWQGVFGNCDGEHAGLIEKSGNRIQEGQYTIHLDGRDFALIHNLDRYIPEDVDIVIFGHTHEQEIKKTDSGLFVNPGECCGYLSGFATIAILDTETLKVENIKI